MNRTSIFAVAGCLGMTSACAAQLSLNVDPDSQTLWFSGSDAGATDVTGTARWGPVGSFILEDSVILTAAGVLGSSQPSTLVILEISQQQEIRFLWTDFGTPAMVSFAGTGSVNAFSYAGLSPLAAATLGGADGQLLPLTQGSGYSGIEINVIPATGTLCFVPAALLIVRRRR